MIYLIRTRHRKVYKWIIFDEHHVIVGAVGWQPKDLKRRWVAEVGLIPEGGITADAKCHGWREACKRVWEEQGKLEAKIRI